METQSDALSQETPGPPVPLRWFVLHDVQGLYGGRALWAAEGDRAAVVQRVSPGRSGLWEQRCQVPLTFEQWAEVERLVGAHRFLTLSLAHRPGVPDEGRPTVVITPRSGATVTVWKWANDRHPDFDPVYAFLRDLCPASGDPIHEGPFDWQWRPARFEGVVF